MQEYCFLIFFPNTYQHVILCKTTVNDDICMNVYTRTHSYRCHTVIVKLYGNYKIFT